MEDCSGRSMATLLVAWVSAAMVASILLRWKYMWIALAILTILFLIACALAAYSSRRSADDGDTEAAAREESRFDDPRIDIQSISADISQNYPYRVEPPAYQTYWITELPPPYTIVIGSDPPPLLAQVHNNNSSTSNEGTQSSNTMESQLSSPPPYSVAIQPNHTSIQIGTLNDHHYQTDHTNNTVGPITTSQSVSINRNDNNNNNNNNKDETDDGSKTPPPNVLSTGTQYLSNFISNTFGRGQQRLRNFERRTSAGIVSISANQESTSSCSRTGQTTS